VDVTWSSRLTIGMLRVRWVGDRTSNAAAGYERFVGDGAPLAFGLRDEPFGQRRFGSFDRAGVWSMSEQVEPWAGWCDK
jgi:hypothetical protein